MPTVFAHPGHVIAALAALGALVLATPSHAQGTTPGITPGTTQAQPAQKVAAAKPTKTQSHAEHVEGRISELHAKFHITAAQEEKWNDFAQTMRENAKRMDDAMTKRSQTIKGMSAVDDLRSYRDMTETHYDNLKKLVSAFEPLYESMSPDQKKTADSVFASAQSARASARQGKVAKGS